VEIVDDYTGDSQDRPVFSPFLENIATMRIACKAYFESATEEDLPTSPSVPAPTSL
jgi:hypothetical protein